MSRSSDSDPYLDPTTGVFVNRLDITDESTLEQIEAALVATRSYELARTPLQGRFDLAHLQAYTSIYSATCTSGRGSLRTIDISKGGNRPPIIPG